jgi:hypothetical protein
MPSRSGARGFDTSCAKAVTEQIVAAMIDFVMGSTVELSLRVALD